MKTSYFEDVMKFGNRTLYPSRHPGNLKRLIEPSDIATDGAGNILAMPLLRERLCFGRPEHYLRHGLKESISKTRAGLKPVLTRCGRCKARTACRAIVKERIEAKPAIRNSVLAWWAASSIPGLAYENKFIGPLAPHWTAVKAAIAAEGPFGSSNDAAIADDDRSKEETTREKWLVRQRKSRERRKVAMLPDIYTLQAAPLERGRRFGILVRACADPSASKVLRSWNKTTCAWVCDIWLARTILAAQWENHGPTAIVRWLVGEGLSRGKGAGALRTRVNADLKRLAILEHSKVWGAFDPLGKDYDPELRRILGDIDRSFSNPLQKPPYTDRHQNPLQSASQRFTKIELS